MYIYTCIYMYVPEPKHAPRLFLNPNTPISG